MGEVDEQDVLDEAALDDLYAWIDAVPLTRPKRNIARDFSDGVLVAEIIHHYLPRAVDIHNYVVASSTGQKRINWNTLNRKVFAKMNIKLNEATLNQVIEAKPGAIEQILWDLRRKILEHASVTTPKSENLMAVPSRAGFGYGKLSKNTPSTHVVFSKSIVATNTMAPNKIQDRNNRMQDHPSTLKPIGSRNEKMSIAQAGLSQSRKTIPISETSFNTEMNSKPATGQFCTDLEDRHRGDSVTNMENGSVTSLPGQIVYRGHKMVPVEIMDNKEKELRDMENVKKNLQTKIDRLEKLVELKDQRITDLTHQIQNLRKLYEQVTQRKWDGSDKMNTEGPTMKSVS